MKGLIVAAPASNSGKTLVTLGLLRHIVSSGESIVSAKVGPDYIDPGFHAVASGRPCHNIDVWAMREETLGRVLSNLARDAKLVLCEGVMGLFDGASVASGQSSGSTADVARVTGWPVILVIDASAQAASAAAVVRGFATHEPNVKIAGVIFNRIGGSSHENILRGAMYASFPHIPVVGCLPRAENLVLPARHLGLVQALEHPNLEAFINGAADMIEEHIDSEMLLSLARPTIKPAIGKPGIPPLGQRIAIACDAAFAFTYRHVFDGWKAEGAELRPFSPLANEAPWSDADAVYLPGGYPELFAGKLSTNMNFLNGLQDAALRGACLFGECGGYMVLGRSITDAKGSRHTMAGLLGLETSFESPRLHLGYRVASLAAEGFLGTKNKIFFGHEFHYATVLVEEGEQSLFQTTNAASANARLEGLIDGNVAGSFVHLIDQETLPGFE